MIFLLFAVIFVQHLTKGTDMRTEVNLEAFVQWIGFWIVALKGCLTKAVTLVISSIFLFFFFASMSIYDINTRTVSVPTHSLSLSPFFLYV